MNELAAALPSDGSRAITTRSMSAAIRPYDGTLPIPGGNDLPVAVTDGIVNYHTSEGIVPLPAAHAKEMVNNWSPEQGQYYIQCLKDEHTPYSAYLQVLQKSNYSSTVSTGASIDANSDTWLKLHAIIKRGDERGHFLIVTEAKKYMAKYKQVSVLSRF